MLFGCLTANFGPLLRRQPHSPVFNLCAILVSTRRSREPRNEQFGHAWPHTSKMIVSIWRKLWWLSAGQKSTLSFMFFLRYCKDRKTYYFEYFGHAWLCTPNVRLSTCRKPSCWSAGKKINFIPQVFLWILKR